MTKNENGVYFDYRTETVAARGRARAEVRIAKCDDGLYRYSLDVRYSYGGFSGPIADHGDGYATHEQAKTAGIAELLERFPTAWGSEPQNVHAELQQLREQVEAQLRQPSLF
ncbi:unnamed protein product [Gemmata massiliana]|uniref:Uncharacterized protein n=1 Tax=Gemmata massiliana TaxID=1210884 RepID=A0A6P2CWL4_9BACT|nr:hypothetical protein [Gemmata massiliana]VTR93381.1 unnamed protein product [Gemmata massiliana]